MNNEYISKQDAVDAATQDSTENRTHSFRAGQARSASRIKALPAAAVAPVVRCKDCIHNNNCDIQHSAQAGENFFCGFGETEKDVREDVYD